MPAPKNWHSIQARELRNQRRDRRFMWCLGAMNGLCNSIIGAVGVLWIWIIFGG